MPGDRAPRFPNPERSPRLVLYPLVGGGVALDWHLDPAVIERARSAFPAHQSVHQPIAKLYLRRAEGDGAQLAEAAIDLSSDLSGQAQFPEPVVGILQAELGLEGQHDGGWLLLARSNQLQTVPGSLGLARLAPQSAVETDPEPSARPTPDSGAPRAVPPAPELDPKPGSMPAPASATAPVLRQTVEPGPQLVPAALVDPRLERRREPAPLMALMSLTAARFVNGPQAMPAPVGPPPFTQSPSPSPSPSNAAVTGTAARLTTRFPDPSLAALADRAELRAGPFPLIDVALGGFRAENALRPMPSAQSLGEQVLLDQEPLRRQDVATSEAPAQGSEQRPSEQVADGQREQPSNRRELAQAPRGSGPIAPYPSGDEAVVQGELHVFGRAAPGSLLDLGGHPFRVGPGGRFSLRVALDDPELLTALLARLPRLPVAEREP